MKTLALDRRMSVLGILFILSFTVVCNPAQAQFTYQSYQLGTGSTIVESINDSGIIVGQKSDLFASGFTGFVDNNNSITYLNTQWHAEPAFYCINDDGDYAGEYPGSVPKDIPTAFIVKNGVTTSIDLPTGFEATTFINNSNELAGTVYTVYFNAGSYGYTYRNGALTMIDPSGNKSTYVTGINNSGQITGYDLGKSFIYDSGTYTYITVPGELDTCSTGINDSGQVVGTAYGYPDTEITGFIYSGGKVTKLLPPSGWIITGISGINNSGEVVGTYRTSTNGNDLGFVYYNGQFTTIDPGQFLSPRPTLEVRVTHINNKGQVAGDYYDTAGSGTSIGFVATPIATPIPSISEAKLGQPSYTGNPKNNDCYIEVPLYIKTAVTGATTFTGHWILGSNSTAANYSVNSTSVAQWVSAGNFLIPWSTATGNWQLQFNVDGSNVSTGNISASVTRFHPVINGWQFANNFDNLNPLTNPLLGVLIAYRGLCTGMSREATAYFNLGLQIPLETQNNKKTLYNEILRAHVEANFESAADFIRAEQYGSDDLDLNGEANRVTSKLAQGTPAVIILSQNRFWPITGNGHAVAAMGSFNCSNVYAASSPNTTTNAWRFSVYDPNALNIVSYLDIPLIAGHYSLDFTPSGDTDHLHYLISYTDPNPFKL